MCLWEWRDWVAGSKRHKIPWGWTELPFSAAIKNT